MDAVLKGACSLIVALSVAAGAAYADDMDPREYRLLKSWGMQVDDSGRLHFRPGRERAAAPTGNWQPDVSAYRVRPEFQPGDVLQPVVISAKQK